MPLREEYWAVFYTPEAKGKPGVSFVLDLMNVPLDATARVRDAAEELLREQGPEWALVRNTARAIADICSIRLAHRENWAPATVYIVRAPWEPRDSPEHVLAQQARVATWAQTHVDEADAAAAMVWGAIHEAFRQDRAFQPYEK